MEFADACTLGSRTSVGCRLVVSRREPDRLTTLARCLIHTSGNLRLRAPWPEHCGTDSGKDDRRGGNKSRLRVAAAVGVVDSDKWAFESNEDREVARADRTNSRKSDAGALPSRGRRGAGGARGLTNLSAGFIVRAVASVLLTSVADWLRSRDRSGPSSIGTSNTLTDWPGSRGHPVVDGSAGLW